jgi:hypothetical protein
MTTQDEYVDEMLSLRRQEMRLMMAAWDREQRRIRRFGDIRLVVYVFMCLIGAYAHVDRLLFGALILFVVDLLLLKHA